MCRIGHGIDLPVNVCLSATRENHHTRSSFVGCAAEVFNSWTSPGSVDTTSEQVSLRTRLRGGSRGVALAVGIRETALRDWVRRAEIDAGNGLTGTLTSDERDELARLRRENKRVLMDLEILKKAAAFFARGNH